MCGIGHLLGPPNRAKQARRGGSRPGNAANDNNAMRGRQGVAREGLDVNAVKEKVWFLREGLFAKYVVALVGLVVFVLAVNGAMEIWISYRGIKSSLTDGMSEKAEATAKRIQQSMSDLERQINWVTRAAHLFLQESRTAAPTMRSC